MAWILGGMALILLGLVGIYFWVYKYDRDKVELNHIDSPTTDSIIVSILFFIGVILIAVFFEKLPIWLARSILFLVCLLPILIGVMIILEEI
ncbi:hypothetical protein HMPREF1210_02619 [Paenisporosarcina sp. HGH0030]|uniref:hypothetical protein n=1 Tax=Paenisporosarcina sp. HGH0030 TaxID=1078085 RepID=UPI00034E5322|nr:hypothetical protein [Paenisporosarcina sp. HGH0030]EPD50649.1 hypothetical protein HMPREF1210_02619 [Paenisporosarcina sp. HGH0030]